MLNYPYVCYSYPYTGGPASIGLPNRGSSVSSHGCTFNQRRNTDYFFREKQPLSQPHKKSLLESGFETAKNLFSLCEGAYKFGKPEYDES